MTPRSITIIGAGMGGLTTALALRQAGHTVHVFDRVSALRPAGAALSVWSNGVKVLAALGLETRLKAASGTMTHMAYADQHGRPLTHFDITPLYSRVGQPACPIARTALQTLLLEAVGEDRVSLGENCTHYTTTETGITAHFNSGLTVESDLLVVADGTHSILRNQAMGETIERRYCGYVNWNGRVPVTPELGDPECWIQYVGHGQRVSMMPMGEVDGVPHFYFFLDVPLPDGTPNDPGQYRAELARHFDGWAEPVQTLIARIDPAHMARVEIHDIDPLPRLTASRVALLGDAAHGMSPDLGQGGCQAMEDAWVLARALDDADTLDEALATYDHRRVDRVGDIILRARKRAATTHGKIPALTHSWYQELTEETGEHIMAGMEKTILGGPLV
ncbi:FAD-dependent urate hydroxylase HpxO [Larsenimonas rhizosphaerae]|uniref:FAD-dependent urate hydroxylase n=1 Tax=Larsenimonas rhizosphaerae TaxID=2944682 RepID=A0AA41ZID1_9GAMM|nr:FAD-dependent urate hydroxylase HpxO [Larsenimonas rhizosphaerae]MCX2525256.1 FAD-dependent urate hydroxylase HpxO [Larsenimonas rhizosphaerae]